ncbi:hypothetical protein [Gimesia sp.]|uniref:hypothetical protein n=1 Tax=Gimesia sp. TaxID=2024833 RepID=UPI003A8DC705
MVAPIGELLTSWGFFYSRVSNAPVSMADRHYTTVPQDLLNEAVLWSGDELGIKNLLKAQEQSVK